MRQRSVLEAIRDTLALNVLLPDARNHLGDIDRATLGARTHHRNHAILRRKRILANLASILHRLVEKTKGTVLELTLVRLSRIVVKEVLVHLEQNRLDLLLLLLNLLVHLLLGVRIGNEVADSHREAIVNEELGYRVLEAVDELHGVLAAVVVVGHVNDALTGLAEDALVELALHDVALANDDPRLAAVHHVEIDRRKQLANHLLARPVESVPLRCREHTCEPLVPHHHVHELAVVELHRVAGEPVGAHKGILHNANDGKAVTRAEDLVRNRRDLLELRRRLNALRGVGIHLITVKVSIIGSRHGNIQAECLAR
uniref:Uncharacterized protein n=1 Tax=viral metagenome TaxID=1070528 RepID=A0A6C0LB15_9ZZZZ